ncbi:hypothetical protein GCM10027093_08730 [Paraburkholderia jirisanensis]
MPGATKPELLESLETFEQEMFERFAYVPERDNESIARGEWNSAYKHPTDAARFQGWHIGSVIQRQSIGDRANQGECMPQLLRHCRSYLTLLETLPFAMGHSIYEIETLREAIASAEQSTAI